MRIDISKMENYFLFFGKGEESRNVYAAKKFYLDYIIEEKMDYIPDFIEDIKIIANGIYKDFDKRTNEIILRNVKNGNLTGIRIYFDI